jgi:hypothetical protein
MTFFANQNCEPPRSPQNAPGWRFRGPRGRFEGATELSPWATQDGIAPEWHLGRIEIRFEGDTPNLRVAL